MYKIETHLHTKHSSKCGYLSAGELVSAYKAAGYDAIIVTDHYNRTTFDFLGVDLHDPGADKVKAFLTGYYLMKAEGEKQGIRIFKGAELRFDECDNDYLFYGWRDDLLADPEAVFRMGIADFSRRARAEGAIIVQAHPYRDNCTPAIACYLDGMEVKNLNPRHDSRNERAEEYAAWYGLFPTAGSDCHQTPDIALTGILTAKMPDSDLAMARLLKSRRYTLL